jgi:hypothetical protein
MMMMTIVQTAHASCVTNKGQTAYSCSGCTPSSTGLTSSACSGSTSTSSCSANALVFNTCASSGSTLHLVGVGGAHNACSSRVGMG